MKICSICKIEKDFSEFCKDISRKDKLYCQCKECVSKYDKILKKEYQIKNKEKIRKQKQKNYLKNKEKITEKNLKYRKKNREKILEQRCQTQNSKVNYDTFAPQISYADKVRNIEGFLQTKCAYCGKWYFPLLTSVQSRIRALNGNAGECRLYCSTECKQVCPIFKKSKFQEGHPLKNENSSREVQPELRQMVFERDEYTCIKCGKHQNELDVALHCHHMEGIIQNPIESADMDMCVTVCKDCHNEIHQENGCGYNDMKCKTREIK